MTIVVDTSALVAVLLGEAGWAQVQRKLETASRLLISAATMVEAGIVIEAKLGPAGQQQLDVLMRRLRMDVRPLDEEQAERAISAWRRYGRGRHPARLNLGDCFSYALAAELGLPLLFVGEDFAQTDVESALEA